MNARQYRTALRLAELASDAEVVFSVERSAAVLRDRYVWYPVTATRVSDGVQWSYLLRAEFGSYVGSHVS